MALIFILLTTLLSGIFIPQAAILEIDYSGVSVQRVSTEAWLPLQQRSIAPIANGDNIRTNSKGRATIHFSDIASVFVLSDSYITLHNFSLSDEGYADIALTVNGLSIYTFHQPQLVNDFSLTVGDIVITQPAQSFAVWVTEANLTSVIVHQGTLTLEVNGETHQITENSGYNQLRDTTTPIYFSPLNEATLLTSIIRCEGIATAADNQNLTVRYIPSAGGQVLGYIQDRSPVYIIGVSSDQRRLRVRYYSSFGWVEATGVSYQCDNLPTYQLAHQEKYHTIINPSADEYALTYPYFGSVIDDPYFYVYQNAPLGE
jgi:hypothetical protein